MIREPTANKITSLAEDLGMDVTEEEAEDYAHVIETTLADYEALQGLPEPDVTLSEQRYSSSSGHRSAKKDDPHNAWITQTQIRGSDSGALAAKRIGLKDNIALAGVEMTCGSNLLEGHVPSLTATVVQRMLDAGGTILGKNNMDSFGFAASGDHSDFGPVQNPADEEYLAGGSSSGCAAALAADQIDIALGTDQGGSICVPAANCGVAGLRPTTGLVPYTGIVPMERTIDHVGPMAQTVEDVALALETIAGRDGFDSRQPPNLPVDDYTDALDQSIAGETLAVLEEGFDHQESKSAVTDTVEATVDVLEELGAEVRRVSVPVHQHAPPVAWLIWGYGSLQVFKHGGQVPHHDGWYNTDFTRIFSKCQEAAIDTLPSAVKATLLAMEYLDQHHTALYGKAQNIRREIRQQYDSALDDVSAMVMPTTPGKPLQRNPTLDRVERIIRTFPPNKNTCPFAITGHPALTVPCGTVDGLPIGAMFVGQQFDESTLLTIGATYEKHRPKPQ